MHESSGGKPWLFKTLTSLLLQPNGRFQAASYLHWSWIPLIYGHTGNLQTFDSFGYVEDQCEDEACSKANYLKGNLLINGLMLWGDEEELSTLKNRLYIHGRLISFNTFMSATDQRKRTVQNILIWRWKSDHADYIALDKLFSWSCDPQEGKGYGPGVNE